MAEFLFGPVPHEEAIKFIADKPVVSREVFNKLLPELKARAFTISGIEGANAMQSIRDKIAELPAGGDWDTIKQQIADDLANEGLFDNPDADEESRAASAEAAERRAEILLRTHGFQAYSAARFNVMNRQKDALPFWKYQTVGDEHVRDEHAALDGVILPADSPFWNDHYPPWDWGCRCLVVPLDAEEVAEIREAEKDLDGDKRSLLEGELQRQLEVNGRIARGPTQVVDVRSPRDKGVEAPFVWQPGNLRVPIQKLRGQWDAPVFDSFEQWAKRQIVNERDQTVWNWLNQKQRPPLATRDSLRSEDVKRKHRGAISQGVSRSDKITLEDGTVAVRKPIEGLGYEDFLEGPLFHKDSSRNGAAFQIAADDISRALGWEVVAPASINKDGSELRTAFTEGVALHSSPRSEIDRQQWERVAFIDYVIGQQDGHSGNYLVTADGKLVGFDLNIAGGERFRSTALEEISRETDEGGVAKFSRKTVNEVERKLDKIAFREEVSTELQDKLLGRIKEFLDSDGEINWEFK